MIRSAAATAQRLLGLALALASFAILTSCGSGAVSGPPTVITPSALSVSPSSAVTMFSGLPSSFVITGGSGTYFVTSSNQAIIPNSDVFAGNLYSTIPNDVSADTSLTLTFADNGGSVPIGVPVTVQSRTVSNVVTITPSASQAASCGTSVCAGGDAQVSVKLAQNGVPLVNRLVRFDVTSGDVRFITSAPGQSEEDDLTTTALTDGTGTAVVRIRALASAPGQTALIQVTDTSSGFAQSVPISIAPSTNAALNAQPSTIAFKGNSASSCASGLSADVLVFGGKPPYQISQPGTFTVSPSFLSASGSAFTVTATGQCTDSTPIAVVDSNGATATVTVSNAVGATTATTPDIKVSPDTVTLDQCADVANVAVTGGTGGPYFVASGSNVLTVRVSTANSHVFAVQRNTMDATHTTSPITVAFSDGKTSASVAVTLGMSLPKPAQGTCP
ncbi:MAG TPA: hypothetical protein VH040_01115 [Usitatibacter sp.]|nr:hypothetical protein [Usitatibacter sp.]